MLKHRRLGSIKACTKRADPRVRVGLGSTIVPQRTGELESNGYWVMVSAEEYRSVNERVSHQSSPCGVGCA